VNLYNAAWAIPLLFLLGGLGSLGVETHRRAAQLCVFFSALACIAAAFLLGVRLTHDSQPAFDSLLTFFAMTPPEGATFATQFQAQIGIHVDALSVSFAAALSFATLIVQWYAVHSTRADQGFRRFFCASSVLGFATTGFVLSPNLFDSLMLWTVGSAALFVLLTLSWQHAESTRHALRAYVVIAAGDIALTLGVVFTWIKFGVFSSLLTAPSGQSIADPFSFKVISQGVYAILRHTVAGSGPRALLVLGIVFVVAACVRAAQFPFSLWLSDTAASSAIPVLALAAATVAPLGVYLVARVYPVLAQSPRILPALALVGGISAILAAVSGIAQRRLSRIAVSAATAELGLALVALGMGGYSPGLFIAFTSIFTSTLLILVAGNLIHVYKTDDIAEMGGAWPKLRSTTIAFAVWALLAGGLALSSYYAISAALSGADPAGGTFSGRERVVMVIVTIVAALLIAVLAGRVFATVTTGAITRRRGFQHDRVADVDRLLRRPIGLLMVASVLAVLVGLPGLQPFTLGTRRIAGLTFMRFVVYGKHPQSISIDGIALLIALLALVGGFAAAWLWFGPARRTATLAAAAAFRPLRVAEEGFYVGRLTNLAARPLLAIAGRIASFDDEVTAPIAASVGESADLAAIGLGALRNARFARYLAGGIVVIAVLALLSVLAATGHLWVHLS
jgi:NADH-quinone oxidoreductase subunit L